LPLRYPSPSECPAPVQSSGEVRHRLIDIGVPVGSQPYPISSRVVPPGNRIVLGGVTALIDSFAEQLVACENKDDWTLFGLQTDEYLKAHEPTYSLAAFDQYVDRTGEAGEGYRPSGVYRGFGGTFGWVYLPRGRVGAYLITGTFFVWTDDSVVVAAPEVEFLILDPTAGSYLLDARISLGEIRSPQPPPFDGPPDWTPVPEQ
jgi:hypothetical protein